MRLPLYQAQVSPTSEAPGRPFQARRNANLEAQTQLSKGAPLSQALAEVNNITAVRINMARENLLSEATLGLDEKLDQAFREFKQYGSPNTKFSGKSFNKVLDGENPFWDQRMETIKSELKQSLGKDKYMNNKFDLYFNQSELRGRLKLRGIIDTKVRAAAVEHRNMLLQSKQEKLSQPLEVDAETAMVLFDQEMSGIVTDKKKKMSYTDGKGNTLFTEKDMSNQELAFTTNVASEFIKNISLNDPNVNDASTVIDEIRTVVFASKEENKDVTYADLDENQKYAVRLLRKLKDPALKYKVLSNALGIASFAEGETKAEKDARVALKLEEKLAKENAQAMVDEAKLNLDRLGVENDDLSAITDDLTTDLHSLDIGKVSDLLNQVDVNLGKILAYEEVAGVVPKNSAEFSAAISLRERLVETANKARHMQGFHKQTNRFSQEKFIKNIDRSTSMGAELSDMLEGELALQEKAFKDGNGLGHVIDRQNLKAGDKVGGFTYQPFDLSLLNKEEEFKAWFDNHKKVAQSIHRNFNPNSALTDEPIQYFTGSEIAKFNEYYNSADPAGKLRVLEDFVSSMGAADLDNVLQQMDQNPHLVVAARLLEFAEDNPQGATSIQATQTAAFIVQGNDRISKGEALPFMVDKAQPEVRAMIESAFVDSAKENVDGWMDAVNSYLVGRFSQFSGTKFITLEQEEKLAISRNALLYGFNQIHNAENTLYVDGIDKLNSDDYPWAAFGGMQVLNDKYPIYLPSGINASDVQTNLGLFTLKHLNASASRTEDGELKWGEGQAYEFTKKAIEDIQANSDKYGFLANSDGDYQLVRKKSDDDLGYGGENRPVLDANGQVVYVNMNLFALEQELETYDASEEIKGKFTFN